MTAATRAQHLAALARQPVYTAVDVVRPAGTTRREIPNPDRYDPATLDVARLALRRRPVIVAVSAFGKWRHGELVKVGRTRLAVAYVTTASPDAVHDVTELPEHVYLLRTLSAPLNPTEESTVMPVRRPKPTTTVAEAAAADLQGGPSEDDVPAELDVRSDPPAQLDRATANRIQERIANRIQERIAGSVAGGKKPRGKKAAGSPVQALLTASEQGAVDATFLPALPIGRVVPSEDNPRDSLPDLDELRDSIAEHGVLEPLVVAEAEGAVERDEHGLVASYDLVFGHRRLAAAAAAGLTAVPAVVRNDLAGRPAHVARLVENLQRADLNPIEEAKGIHRLVADGMQQKDVAVAISRNPGHVSKRLQLLKADDRAQELVAAGRLPVDVAVELSRLPVAEQRQILDATTHPDSISGRVSRRAEELKSRAELEKVAKQLRAGGLEVIVTNDYPRTSRADGPEYLERLRADDDFELPKRHDKAACHAALVAPAYYLLGSRTADELADDPLSAYYRLVCTAPETHLTAAAKAGAGGNPAHQARRDAEDAETAARSAALEQLLAERWSRVLAAVAAKPDKTGAGSINGRVEHTLRVLAFDRLVTVELDERAWALTDAALAGAPVPDDIPYLTGDVDVLGVPAGIAAIRAGGADLAHWSYAHALAVGWEALRYQLRAYRGRQHLVSGARSVAALHLRHMADLAGGGIPADPDEQLIALEGADLEAACRDMELLAPAADPDAGRPVEDVHLPEPNVADVLAEEVSDADAALKRATSAAERRRAVGVTSEAEADYSIRIGPGEAYLVPGLRTAKGQCGVCHAQVSIRAGGLAGKHDRDGGTCRGAGEPVMTLDEALPDEATGEPAEVDPVACPTCEGVGRDSSDGRCRTCNGKGLVTPQLQAV